MSELFRDLGDGLLLRRADTADTDALAAFNIKIHSDDPEELEEWLGSWTRDLMSGNHPIVQPHDFTVVIDTLNANKIVSSLVGIPQIWRYDGIPFSVGRPELIGTDPAYRRRGLVRVQMDVFHTYCAQQGDMVQAITGIAWYYRMFGYEMALDLGGGREFFWSRPGNDTVPGIENYRMRPAVVADISSLMELYDYFVDDSLVSCVRDEQIWQFGLAGARRDSVYAMNTQIIETLDGTAVAYVDYRVWGTAFTVRELGVLPGHSWRDVCLFLSRELKRQADELNKGRKKPISHISFGLKTDHPVFKALDPQLEKSRKPYAWYMRVPDLPVFIQHIAPSLERRLAVSVMAGHSGTLRLNFFKATMALKFEQGRLVDVDSFEPQEFEDGDALFPDLSFLQLLFGYRSLAELMYAFADCQVNNAEAKVLLAILFPKRPSQVFANG